jgi:lysophospholipase L1-like esterase
LTPSAGAKRRGLAFRLGVALAALALVLLLAELGLRAAGFRYRLYPERIEFGYPNPRVLADALATDPDLFWVPRDYQERLSALREVRPPLVCMGDSCTELGEYHAALAVLAARARPGKRLPYANLGVSGWSSHQGLAQLERDVLPLAPEVVTIWFGWNDHWIGFGVRDAEVSFIHHSPLFALLERSRLAQLVSKAWVGAARDEGAEPPLRVPPDEFRANLVRMVRLAREHGIVPVLITAPSSHRAGEEPEYLLERHLARLEDLVPLHRRYVEIVRTVAADEGAVLCDLARAFEALDPDRVRDEYFFKDGIHLRPAGSLVAGEMLLDCFEANGLLEQVLR